MSDVIILKNLIGNQHINHKKRIHDLLERNREVLLNGDVNNGICYDGIVDEKAYISSPLRIAFLLKETNGNKPNGQAPDQYNDWEYIDEWIVGKLIPGQIKLYPAYKNIAMWTSIFYDIADKGVTDKSEYINSNGQFDENNEKARENLKKTAIINLKKTWGKGTTNINDIYKYLSNEKIVNILLEELYWAKPSVVLCGGREVFDLAYKIVGGKPETIHTKSYGDIPFFVNKDSDGTTFYFKFYHPSCRKSREYLFDYANEVLDVILNTIKGER